jgi:hypothetical protein
LAIFDLPPASPPLQEAQVFLRLLNDVSLIQRLLLEETQALRARVRELEAGRAAASGPAPRAGNRP